MFNHQYSFTPKEIVVDIFKSSAISKWLLFIFLVKTSYMFFVFYFFQDYWMEIKNRIPTAIKDKMIYGAAISFILVIVIFLLKMSVKKQETIFFPLIIPFFMCIFLTNKRETDWIFISVNIISFCFFQIIFSLLDNFKSNFETRVINRINNSNKAEIMQFINSSYLKKILHSLCYFFDNFIFVKTIVYYIIVHTVCLLIYLYYSQLVNYKKSENLKAFLYSLKDLKDQDEVKYSLYCFLYFLGFIGTYYTYYLFLQKTMKKYYKKYDTTLTVENKLIDNFHNIIEQSSFQNEENSIITFLSVCLFILVLEIFILSSDLNLVNIFFVLLVLFSQINIIMKIIFQDNFSLLQDIINLHLIWRKKHFLKITRPVKEIGIVANIGYGSPLIKWTFISAKCKTMIEKLSKVRKKIKLTGKFTNKIELEEKELLINQSGMNKFSFVEALPQFQALFYQSTHIKGESGAGKTTAINTIIGAEKLDGQIFYDNKSASPEKPVEFISLLENGVQYISQFARLDELRVKDIFKNINPNILKFFLKIFHLPTAILDEFTANCVAGQKKSIKYDKKGS